MKGFIIISLLALFSLYSYSQSQRENLRIVWPEEYNWKIGSNQEDDKQHMVELIPGSESIDNWTIIGTMMSIKGITGVPNDVAMNLMYDQSKLIAVKPILTVIERNDSPGNNWIIFKIESAKFKNSKKPESQLYYIIQGEKNLYSNFVAIKEKSLSKEFVEKWTAIFKASEFVTD